MKIALSDHIQTLKSSNIQPYTTTFVLQEELEISPMHERENPHLLIQKFPSTKEIKSRQSVDIRISYFKRDQSCHTI